jgi:DNA-binding transcriptional MerR regulator/methylmalonyl-CoA mutase cobalamin-binding subunit
MLSTRKTDVAEGRLTIGALSRATGIPVETLRTWERRYAFPVPTRKPSGHRVYPLSAVTRLRRVAEALARGHRPAEVVPISEASLESLLNALRTKAAAEPPARGLPDVPLDAPAEVRELLAAVAEFDGAALRRRFDQGWIALGPMGFLEQVASPFLREIGRVWRTGEFAIRHEHFASARLSDFLREARRPFEDRADGPRVALLTLPEDQHELGLLMASIAFALEGWRIVYLGPNTPTEQAASLARDAALGAVAVSVSESYAAERGEEELRALRRQLPRAVPLVVGGGGAHPFEMKGVHFLADLPAARAWAGAARRT